PAIAIDAGLGAAALIAAGGILYTAGAVIYARERPNPNPAVFGYHEIFHVLVLAAAAAHFAAVAIYALPAAGSRCATRASCRGQSSPRYPRQTLAWAGAARASGPGAGRGPEVVAAPGSTCLRRSVDRTLA